MFKKSSLLKSVLATLILFIPLYPKFPLANVTGTYVAIRLDDIVVALAVLIWFVYQAIHHFPVFKTKITRLFLAYFTAITVSLVYAILISQTDPLNILLLNFFRRFEYISLFFLTISTIKNYSDLKFPYIFMIIADIGVIIYGLGQKYFQFPVVSTMNSEFSKGQLLQMDTWTRISSTFAGHYDLAVYLSVILVIIGGIIVTQKNLLLKIGNITIWLISFYLLTLTASRVSIFAFYGGMCLTLILLRRYLWIVPVTLIFAFSLFNSKDLNQRLLATIPAIKNQLTGTSSNLVPTLEPTPTSIPIIAYVTPSINNPKITPFPTVIHHPPVEEYIPVDTDVGVARSGEIRFNVEWPRALNAFYKNPLTGTGLGSITLATDNDYLRTLGESGLLGFITLGAIMLFFILQTLPLIFSKKADVIPLIFFGAMITFLVNATLIDVFEASKTAYLFWIMMGLYYQCLFIKKS
jgi:hypothetical protein